MQLATAIPGPDHATAVVFQTTIHGLVVKPGLGLLEILGIIADAVGMIGIHAITVGAHHLVIDVDWLYCPESHIVFAFRTYTDTSANSYNTKILFAVVFKNRDAPICRTEKGLLYILHLP